MIRVVIGALTAQATEGVVRAVRSDLSPATGAARDLLLGAGDRVAARLEQTGSVPVGGAVITPAGDLPSSFLIHVVTSSDDQPETAQTVRHALRNGLRRAAEWGLTSLAVPALGTGAGAMDHEESARALIEVLREHEAEGEGPAEVTIVVRNDYEAEVFERIVGAARAVRSEEAGGAGG